METENALFRYRTADTELMIAPEDERMLPRKPRKEGSKLDQIIAEARRLQDRRQTTYRERALKLFPWICGRCGRAFSGKALRELTVHHKDHNHDNNPSDGSNWELLCLSCHDKEHARYLEGEGYIEHNPDGEEESSALHRPFAGLEALLKDKK
jgi:5-methylcytosine-specific restriction endonuclease McrA